MFTEITLQVVWKTYTIPPWWCYLFPFAFLTFGRHALRRWRESIDPTATPWQRATIERNFLISGITSTFAGFMTFTIYIYLVCKNWQNTPVWFYFLSYGLILAGIGLLVIWRKSIPPPPALNWDNVLKNYYFIFAIAAIVCGGAGLIFGYK